jgi:hypothetical protein
MLTAVAAFVSTRPRCSRRRTEVIIRPKMHSNNEEWIKPGIEEACIIRVFDMRSAKNHDIMWLSSSTAPETCLRQGDVYAS